MQHPDTTRRAADDDRPATYTAEFTAEQVFGYADLARRLGQAYGPDQDRTLHQDLLDALQAFGQLLPEPSDADGDRYLAALDAGLLPNWGMDDKPLTETVEEWAATVRAQDTAETADKDAAYLHMASFARGHIATISGQGQTVTGEVTVPQQHRGTDIGAAWMTICGEDDTRVTVTVNQMIDGRWLLASADNADRGHWQPFDRVGYRFFTEPGAFPDPDLADCWLAGRRDAADRPGEWFPPRPARCTDEQYWAYSEGWAQAAEPSEDIADFVAAHREAYPHLMPAALCRGAVVTASEN